MRTVMVVLVAGLAFSSAGIRADDPPKGWDFIGHTQAAATVDVRARVTGYLTRIAVKEGAAVKKGEVLAEIDPRPYRLELDAAKARVKVAEAKLQVAKIDAAHTKKLFQQNVISMQELALHEAKAAEAEAALVVAKSEVERAELVLSWTRVTAPFDGRVSRVQVSEGDLVTADQTRILKVISTGPMHVTFNVPETTLLRWRRDGLAEPGKLEVAVGFVLDKGFPHSAKLDSIAPEVDPMTGTVRLRATVANPNGLLVPGMATRVRLAPASK